MTDKRTKMKKGGDFIGTDKKSRYYITTHAINQFRARIAHTLTYEEALEAILKSLKKDIVKAKKSPKRHAIFLYVEGRYKFRAVLVNNSIVTITHWDKTPRLWRG